MNDIFEISHFVGTAVWHTLPFFLISIALSVLVRSLKLDGLIRRAFSARIGTAILLATLVGAFSPFCSCTVIPIIAGLVASGVPLAPVMAFWIASPTMDPEIFALSVGILGWPLALARLGATLALSLGAGYMTLALGQWLTTKKEVAATVAHTTASTNPIALPVLQPALAAAGTATAVASSSCSRPAAPTTPNWRHQIASSVQQIQWPQFGREMGKQSWELGRWLLLAFFLEALITLYVPQAAIANLLGESNRLAVPLAALIGVPLYLNNMGALPIVAGLLAQGMQPGAAIAFLIAGPVTTIPAMTAVWGVVQRRVFVLYLSLSLLGAILLGFVTNFILG